MPHSARTALGIAGAVLLAVLAVVGVTGATTGASLTAAADRAREPAPAPSALPGPRVTSAGVQRRRATTGQPVAGQPVTAQPVTAQPVTAQPVTAQPVTAQPVTAQPLTTQPLHGCPMPDPSGSGGCITPAMGWLMAQVIRAFGDLPVACWDRRDGDPYSDHPKGRACDYTFGEIGRYAGPDDVQRGWTLALWLRANASLLHVNYVIWQGRIWSRAHDAEGWRPYTGGGHYSASGPTNGHFDHVHVSTLD